ncbi:Pentatricopeptide (PPR) repeat-containing-like protein [Theobroma cacao]|uniref:Pentatricopeptide (PPR) repeat-containing-like protein n=1 Tax=Theobroma cacao TaxID=3641 RepID=A0A061GIH4_THECC|nr:Pentatricopeptide (PPR) repeat-containing-like protein [Theobroma cacao]
MAYHHLCSSPSYVFRDRHTLSASPKTRPARSTAPSLKQVSCLFQSKSSIQISHVSLQDPITQTKNTPKHSNSQSPDGKTGSSTKSYVWVNPRSPRASRLRQLSYDSRYSSLVKVADSLDSCKPNEHDVLSVLSRLGNDVLEQDAVVVLNNMSNPHTTLLALNHFQRILKKTSREIILYNVTMKVFRKSKDLDGAEKLFDEMLQKGVKPDNVTFSTLISCARALAAKPNLAIYNTLLDAMGRAKRPWQAKTIYKEMTNNGFSPNWATYATLLRAYGNMEKFFLTTMVLKVDLQCCRCYKKVKKVLYKFPREKWSELIFDDGFSEQEIYETSIEIKPPPPPPKPKEPEKKPEKPKEPEKKPEKPKEPEKKSKKPKNLRSPRNLRRNLKNQKKLRRLKSPKRSLKSLRKLKNQPQPQHQSL